ncbi:hypothetical protein PVK06_036856 [Gossypium arboreum]|uniref:Disease resistance R13L4/SHOC-2-like LRR domain-containing protein n=1 Tax=Gossypium arboreum TaxID=29729 RepID=A0ABR0NLQ5_GOSAR|nr:hypothetical protein PVK06_036856 [Gossypium arboreum]
MFMDFDLSNTGIEEVPDSIGYLDMLEQLDLAGSRVKNVSSNILKLEKLHGLDLSYSMITEFPEIPNNLMQLNLSGTQIKEVSFCSNHLSNLHCLDMSFSSIQKPQCNIALFGSREIRLDAPTPILRSRFLAFSICLVADLIGCVSFSGFDFICEYQLTAASGGGHEKFRSEWHCRQQNWASMECMGDHVLILLSGDMVKNDKGYEQASFEFYIKYYGEEDIKVKKCGVHVSYVDEEPKSQPTA